jgi:dephospho-CoA kinase
MLSFNQFQYIEEGVNDPAIFKAVFLAGGPGSGKSFIVGKTGLPQLGFRVVNSDDAFEVMMKKAGKAMTSDEIFSDEGQAIRGRAKAQTRLKQDIYMKGRLGLVIDGTGKDVNKIIKQAKELQDLGYDTKMILVNTDIETAIKRDSQRTRSLGKKKVTEYWNTVQKNIGGLQTVFGKKNFMIVDNSEGKDYQKETLRAYRDVKKFISKDPENPLAKKWIKQEKEKRGITR